MKAVWFLIGAGLGLIGLLQGIRGVELLVAPAHSGGILQLAVGLVFLFIASKCFQRARFS